MYGENKRGGCSAAQLLPRRVKARPLRAAGASPAAAGSSPASGCMDRVAARITKNHCKPVPHEGRQGILHWSLPTNVACLSLLAARYNKETFSRYYLGT